MDGLASFHTHTKLCNHAVGIPIDYARQAQKQNCSALGFSDHVPYPDASPSNGFYDCWPEIRMTQNEIATYTQWIDDARKAVDFPIYLGFECEWDSAFSDWYKELRKTYNAQYLALGQHWVSVNDKHVYVRNISTKKRMGQYIDQLVEGIASGLFDFVAHPDIFLSRDFVEWDDDAKAWSEPVIDAAIHYNIPLEINGLGLAMDPILYSLGERPPYPFLQFWQMARDKGARIICNSDAHNPEYVLAGVSKARKFAKSNDIPLEKFFINTA